MVQYELSNDFYSTVNSAVICDLHGRGYKMYFEIWHFTSKSMSSQARIQELYGLSLAFAKRQNRRLPKKVYWSQQVIDFKLRFDQFRTF